MLRRVLAVWLLLMQVAEPALAAKKYVNHATGNDEWDGTSATFTSGDTGPWKTIDNANWSIGSLDTVIVAANDTTYDTGISPHNPWTTWIGDSTAREKVIVPSIDLYKRNTTIIGFRVAGGTVVYDHFDTFDGRYQHIRKCTLRSGFFIRSGGTRLDGNRVGTDSVMALAQIAPNADNGDSVVIVNNDFRLRDPSGDDHIFIDWKPDRDYSGAQMSNWTVANNRVTVTLQYDQWANKPIFLGRMKGMSSHDNHYIVRDSSGFGPASGRDVMQAFVFRDSMVGNLSVRDSIELETQIPGTGKCSAFIYSSGNKRPDSANVFRLGFWKSNISATDAAGRPAQGAFQNQWRAGAGDSLSRMTIVSSTNIPAYFVGNADERGAAYLNRNTIVNLGVGPALALRSANSNGNCTWDGGSLEVKGNLIWAPRYDGGAYQLSYPTSGVTSDYNFVGGIYASLGRSEMIGTCTGSGLTPTPVGENDTYDTHSVTGSPQFTDSSYATFDPTIQYGSAAIGAGPGGADCGARDFDAASSLPGQITDLAVVMATDSAVVLRWTASGQHGSSGTADSLDIRYNTSAITTGNFLSSTRATSPTVHEPGESQFVVVTGLAKGTTYYFAVEGVNSHPVHGPLSNVAVARTRSGGGLGAIEP